jgi:hypothetical protein
MQHAQGNWIRWFVAIVAVVLVSGCASGPKLTEVRKSLPTLALDKGRIYFFRSGTMFGAGIQPSVQLNGQVVGESTPGSVFFLDRDPGNYEVLLSTEVERKLTFTLERGQTRYVRMTVGLGVLVYRVYPELVDEKDAEEEMKDLAYTGSVKK